MLLLIDGYNVLKYQISDAHISQEQRESFLKKVAHYAKIKKHRVIVVFDAGPSRFVTHEKKDGIHVIYSGERKTADDVLKGLLLDSVGHDAVLVSSDRELNDYAARCKITSLESSLFYKLLQKESKPAPQTVLKFGTVRKREGHESSEDIDALMIEASEKLIYKDEDLKQEQNFQERGKTASKNEKQARKIVKKL